ncbi:MULTISPECIES: hypothetical protein [Burkholderia]|nr:MULTISPECIES: hypothetical protein [Burkholderia]EKS9798322.1 hypothetical protein [Burkholderia cepacia]EKS9805806.1 hypothetical protein [Burkholderia cepacia]EKS9813161.1 hypothetical protein [Burkholderia cepacia]EKS9822679.1 hypothetical protein [Burkholderia cepacia]EKS9827402.1 hypothetical protein [Burkholderia cepacia]
MSVASMLRDGVCAADADVRRDRLPSGRHPTGQLVPAALPSASPHARSVCIGSMLNVTPPQTIAAISAVDRHPAIPRQTCLPPASLAFCIAARSVCIGSTVAVASSQTIAEIFVVDHHPAVP